MQGRISIDGFRISVSSAPSSSSGSGPDDIESLGDVYVWGAVWGDGTTADGPVNSYPSKTDVLLPKPLETNVVLDVHQIACGVRHAALVTRQGEVFTWGEESGGRLGHGIDKVFSRPQLVEFLAISQVEYVACGEYHMCATSVAGDLYIWGDGTHKAGLLGHISDISHWIPKRVSGPLEGFQVLSVACGSWHSALATFDGKLFTFGDGTFGALGHGNRDSVAYPREVESLSGQKTVRVACGVWHTAAIVEVTEQTGSNMSLKKLFTWGDGDKYRLGHGDKETRLVPFCIPHLSEYDFKQVSCGHNITVALTTSGHVFTMGSTMHGQLGNSTSDGKFPCLVQGKLSGKFIEEISCGAYHVAVLTSRNEVFTWGKGCNGRLGHGDTEDRKSPTLVEALKDKHVKSICCGSNFTASICIHKWVCGADQSYCSGCRQAFGFTRKRHNCYNCGLVHCHACSSKKAPRAALAPLPGKPHRVCDTCYAKLNSAEDVSISAASRRSTTPRLSVDYQERFDVKDVRPSKILLSPTTEPVKYLEVKSEKQGKSDSFSVIRASVVPSLLQLKDIAFPSRFSALQDAARPLTPSTPPPIPISRPASPYSGRPSPPRSAAPAFSKGLVDSLKKTNELLNQEVLKLQSQVKSLRLKCEVQDLELRKSEKRTEVATSSAEAKSLKITKVKEVLKSVTNQLKDMSEKIPPEIYESEEFKSMHNKLESLMEDDISEVSSSLRRDRAEMNTEGNGPPLSYNKEADSERDASSSNIPLHKMDYTSNTAVVARLLQNAEGMVPLDSCSTEVGSQQSIENGPSVQNVPSARSQAQSELIEQFEPGVYVVLVQLQDGTKIYKRVKFSKKKFNSQQAKMWWKENGNKVIRKYNQAIVDDTASTSEEAGPSSASSS